MGGGAYRRAGAGFAGRKRVGTPRSMKPRPWHTIKRLAGLLTTPATDPPHQAERIHFMERNILLPVKVVVIVILFYFLFISNWTEGANSIGQVAFPAVRRFFEAWAIINVIAGLVFIYM